MSSDTIVALASGHGRAGVGVIRVSGPDAGDVLAALTGREVAQRRAALCWLRSASGEILDQALVLWFPRGGSFTGEDVVEFQCHGSSAVVSAVIDEITARPGCRLAEPGEFTLRAYLNGGMQLTSVEALGDLLAAETELQRQQAVRLMRGAGSEKIADWRAKLVRALALIEVTIDWADEEVPEDVSPEVREILDDLVAALEREIDLSSGAERLRSGFEIALLGAPNAGKSSLLNLLAGREAAITSPIPGTTRDVVELRYDLGGLPLVFMDMAGLREATDPVEREGIRRAVERAEDAALRLFLEAEDARFPEAFQGLFREGDLRLRTKSDVGDVVEDGRLAVSAVSGSGIGEVLEAISERLKAGAFGLFGHARQQAALREAHAELREAQVAMGSVEAEILSEHLRRALQAMKSVIGEVGVESVLSAVFENFCLGK